MTEGSWYASTAHPRWGARLPISSARSKVRARSTLAWPGNEVVETPELAGICAEVLHVHPAGLCRRSLGLAKRLELPLDDKVHRDVIARRSPPLPPQIPPVLPCVRETLPDRRGLDGNYFSLRHHTPPCPPVNGWGSHFTTYRRSREGPRTG